MSDAQTLQVYADKADEYADLTRASVANDPLLAAFIAAMPEGGRVHDLGCGPGFFAARMAQAGLQVDATDAVPEMVEKAAALDGVTAWQASFDDLDAQALYDGIWANFSLLHAPRADLPHHLTAICRALKPGGVFHIGMKTGSEDQRDSIGRRYTYVTIAELRGLLTDAGLTVTDQHQGRDAGLSGEIAPWVVLRAHA